MTHLPDEVKGEHSMDLGLAFSFPFQDEEWVKKVLIAAVLLFIPFIGWLAVFGWALEITRRVIRQSEEPLPDWTEITDLLVLGLKGFAISFIYSIPVMLLSVPVMFLGWFEDLEGIVAFLSICTSCLTFLYSIILWVALPAAFGILADSDNVGEAINPSKILELVRAAPGAYVIALVGIIISGLVSSIGIILCFIGVLFTSAYAMAFTGHVYGQAYNEARAVA
jgi:hypothetical protein